MTNTTLPASGRHYLCVYNPNDPRRFVQVEILGWLLKGENAQPVPVTAFGPADSARPMPIIQHFEGSNQGTYYVLPGSESQDEARFLTGPNPYAEMAGWLHMQATQPPPPPVSPPPPLVTPPPPEIRS